MRVVIDTNILVSAIILPHGSVGPVLQSLRHGAYTLLYTPALLEELVDVLNRPRIFNKYNLTEADIHTVIAFILLRGEQVYPVEEITACRDPKDNKLLTAAIAGRADALVSGDKDLLVLHPFRNIPIINPALFLQWLNSPPTD